MECYNMKMFFVFLFFFLNKRTRKRKKITMTGYEKIDIFFLKDLSVMHIKHLFA